MKWTTILVLTVVIVLSSSSSSSSSSSVVSESDDDVGMSKEAPDSVSTSDETSSSEEDDDDSDSESSESVETLAVSSGDSQHYSDIRGSNSVIKNPDPDSSDVDSITYTRFPTSHTFHTAQPVVGEGAPLSREDDIDEEKRREDLRFTRAPGDLDSTEELHTATDDHNMATGVVTTGDIASASDDDLRNIIQNLQSELHATKRGEIRTRSVLMVIQEKQEKQEQDLAILKDELAELTRAQQADQQVLSAVSSLVGNNVWAVKNIKSQQDNMLRDFEVMKAIQEHHNQTHEALEDTLTANQVQHIDQDLATRQLQNEVLNIKTTMSRDRNNMRSIIKALTQRVNTVKLPSPNLDESGMNEALVGEEISREGGGVTTEAPSGVSLEEVIATMQEQKAEMEENLSRIAQNEQNLRQQLFDHSNRFLRYDLEIARMNGVFLNLSLQQSQLENQFLRNERTRYETEMNDLRGTFRNFTHQVLLMEQLQLLANGQMNVSAQNQRELSQMGLLVESLTARTRTLEDLVVEYQSKARENYGHLMSHLNQVNDTFTEFHSSFSSHDTDATNSFQEVDAEFAEMSLRIRQLDNRLAHVEVRALNDSLGRCEKTNNDMMQDMKMTEYHNGVTKLDNEVTQHATQLTRLDRGLSRLYQEVDEQTNVLRNVLGQVQSLVTIIPEMMELKSQVDSLVQILPQDCSERRNSMNVPKSGTYLIKPTSATIASRAYCLFTEDSDGQEETWTIIQKRIDGRVSFERTWRDYKEGFGDPDAEYWIGNDALHSLTTQSDYELKIEMWGTDGQYWEAAYSIFYIDDEEAKYRLHINGYHGNATDSFRYSNYMQFSTLDEDNDASSTHCAKFYTSGWWYKHCHYCNMNGRYSSGIVWFNQDEDEWKQMSASVMKIKPRSGYVIDEEDDEIVSEE